MSIAHACIDGAYRTVSALEEILDVLACSKLKLKCQLDRAWAANLVERVETAVCAAGSQTVRKRLRRMAEEGVRQVVIGIAEIWVVKDVEELGSKTKPHLFGKVKLPLQRKIRLRSSETPQHITPEITLLPNGRCSKRSFVQNLAARILRPVELERHSRVDVRAEKERGGRKKRNSSNKVIGVRRSSQNKTVQRPSPQCSTNNPLRSRSRQIVRQASGEGVPDIKVRIPAVNVRVDWRASRVDVLVSHIRRSIIKRV